MNHNMLKHPWLVAVWPGMGQVAMSAGYYLMAKLDMTVLAEIPSADLFDMDHIEVKGGVIRAGRLPRSRFFVWNDPKERHDMIVFIGEAQPPLAKFAFCRRLIETAKSWGVERIFTFAAMATAMNPEEESRVFSAVTEPRILDILPRDKLETLEDGQIGGMNGVLLAAAREANIPGVCLLGEMPHLFSQLPFPKASLAVLDTFQEIANVRVDLGELEKQADSVSKQLGEFLAQIEQNLMRASTSHEAAEDREVGAMASEESKLSQSEEKNVERLFAESRVDRSKAYELKRELDRLGVFSTYEDRFLDLFKPRE